LGEIYALNSNNIEGRRIHNYVVTYYRFIIFILFHFEKLNFGLRKFVSRHWRSVGMHLYSFNDGAFAGSSCSYDNGGYKWWPSCFLPVQPHSLDPTVLLSTTVFSLGNI